MQRRGRRTIRMAVGVALLGLFGTACGSEVAPATVLVDFSHDQFATQFLRYFPSEVEAHPGDSIRFRQVWTGEPHTVTFGTPVGDALDVTRPLLAEYGDLPMDEVPEEALEEFFAAESSLPTVYPHEGDPESDEPPPLNQTGAQPCLVRGDGSVPEDGSACEERELAPFTGTETLYNSGVIPYSGPSGNVFNMQLADDIAPGSYPFVCLVHGSFHSGVLKVVADDAEVPEPREVSVQAREVIDDELVPLGQAFQRASTEGEYERDGQVFEGNFAGLVRGEMDGVVNEFIPRDLSTKVGEPVTWRFFGPHSISFDVPEYFPILEWQDDGDVTYNLDIDRPAGGAPAPEMPEDPSEPWVIDGGTYDGEGFWSSGVLYSDAYVEYTLRFSEPGEYPFACLIHPPMIGTIRVTE